MIVCPYDTMNFHWEATMLCSACSRSFDGVAKFCSGCGQPLTSAMRVSEPLLRSRYGRMIAGVCAGFAHNYGFDVTLVRLAVCLGAFFSAGTFLLAYLIAWIIMPEAPYALPSQTTGIPAQ